jgi:death-on-curing protein
MATTKYPTLTEALELHRVLVERFGGNGGVRDPGALEAALFRPQTGYYGTLALEAAALMQSLAMNHPFVDGNKRVAFALTAVFLRMNGYRLVVSAEIAEPFVIERLIAGHAPLDEIAAWLARYMKPV